MVDFNITGSNGNFLNFAATAGYIGKPTRATPTGGNRGYNVILGDGANVEELIGSGVNCSYGAGGFKKHDKGFKIGVIDNAALDGDRINVSGHLWKSDFPDVCDTIECSKDALGCSVEVYASGVSVDDEAKTQTLQDVHFTGMAIVYKSKAAFEGTQFMCSIAEKEDKILDEKELQAAVDKAVDEKLTKKFEEFKADFAKQLEELKIGIDDKEKKEDAEKAVDFSELAGTITNAIKTGFADIQSTVLKPAPVRKLQQFASEPQFKGEETLIDLSKKIDEDKNLTPEEKWAAQMRLWLDRDKVSA